MHPIRSDNASRIIQPSKGEKVDWRRLMTAVTRPDGRLAPHSKLVRRSSGCLGKAPIPHG